ncbi:unnamed protein product, partial [Thlaspi arvense]
STRIPGLSNPYTSDRSLNDPNPNTSINYPNSEFKAFDLLEDGDRIEGFIIFSSGFVLAECRGYSQKLSLIHTEIESPVSASNKRYREPTSLSKKTSPRGLCGQLSATENAMRKATQERSNSEVRMEWLRGEELKRRKEMTEGFSKNRLVRMTRFKACCKWQSCSSPVIFRGEFDYFCASWHDRLSGEELGENAAGAPQWHRARAQALCTIRLQRDLSAADLDHSGVAARPARSCSMYSKTRVIKLTKNKNLPGHEPDTLWIHIHKPNLLHRHNLSRFQESAQRGTHPLIASPATEASQDGHSAVAGSVLIPAKLPGCCVGCATGIAVSLLVGFLVGAPITTTGLLLLFRSDDVEGRRTTG